MNSSSRSSATATVLAEFLPVYDKMSDLKEKYSSDQFGGKYGGLSMDSTFAKMGVKEYTAAVGKPLDSFRMAAVESEYSTEFAKDAVIRPVAMGMELEGNVIRAAECVVSLGSEEKEEAEDERNEEEGEENASE
jgi:molecular chaperone GrpE (heat shock protein)